MGNGMGATDQVVPELLARLRAQFHDVQIWFGGWSGQFLAIVGGHLIRARSAWELEKRIGDLLPDAARRSHSGRFVWAEAA